MATEAGPAAAAARAGPSSPARMPLASLVVPWAALAVLAALAWLVTARQARGMETAPGTMGEALPTFLIMWTAMMAAMMFPSVAPIAITWARSITRVSSGLARFGRITGFVSGYLIAWAGYGLLAFGVLRATERWLDSGPGGARWLGAGVYAVAGLYQLTPFKDRCLRHCRSPLSQLIHYGSFQGRARDLRVGVNHGAFCVGCCWALMLVLVGVGVMNVAAMAALATVILLEKLWRGGPALVRVVGAGFLVLAALAPFHPWLAPALDGGVMPMMDM